MTVSAPVRFSPVPPALREIRNICPSPSLKRWVNSSRSLAGVSPSRYMLVMFSASRLGCISASMRVNWENSSTRCPFSRMGGSTSINSSSLALSPV